MIHNILLVLGLFWAILPAQAQTLIARYPLKNDGKDATNQQGNLKLLGIKFEEGGAKCEGTYDDYDAGKGVAILSPSINKLDLQNFSIRVDFKVASLVDIPVFVLDEGCRLVRFSISSRGRVILAYQNGDVIKQSTLTYKPNTWHTATIVALKTGGLVAYLDGAEAARIEGAKVDFDCAEKYGSKDISTTDFSNGNTFKGFWRDLRVYNGTWTPQTKETPPTDKPVDVPVDKPITVTSLGAWKSTDFAVVGKPSVSLDALQRQFFSLKNKTGNLEIIWQDTENKKVYLTRFDANLKNPQHLTLPTPANSNLLAATNDEQDNYYLAVFKEKVDANTNQILTLCKVDKNAKQVAQKNQSSDKKDLNIWNIKHWGATMVQKDGKLALFMARTMNKSGDGLNHQGGIAVLFDANTLEVVHNFGQTSGHSFDNFLTINKNGEFLGMDLGDNYPRGIHLHKFATTSKWTSSKVVYTFKTEHGTSAQSPAGQTYPKYDEISSSNKTYYKWSNDNGTYTELGGIVEVSDGYLVIFAGEPDAQGKSINNARAGYDKMDSRNLGFVKVRKDFEKTEVLKDAILSKGLSETGGFYTFGGYLSKQQNEGVNWLTKLKNPQTENVQNIKTMELPNGNILILYAVDGSNSWQAGKDNYQPYMMCIDAQGKQILAATALDKNIRLNRRDEIVLIGKRIVVVQGVAEEGNKLRIHTLELK